MKLVGALVTVVAAVAAVFTARSRSSSTGGTCTHERGAVLQHLAGC
jgi:hypothetical protein